MKKDNRYQQRLVELRPMIRFIEAAIETLGRDKAKELAVLAFEKYAYDRFVEDYQKLSMEKRWPIFRDGIIDYADGDTYSIEKYDETMVKIKYHRCVFLEIFRDFGLEDFIPLYCRTDYAVCRAIDPRIQLIRTQTLAEGAEYCDHCWSLRES